MDVTFQLLVLLSTVLSCNGASIKDQLAHIAQRRLESEGISGIDLKRRYNMPQGSVILGAPSYTAHLPQAEPILPGHTLIKPAVNMLKSAVKYPHLELDNGSGVYGNVNNLGLRYDGKNERLMYSGFRRSPAELVMYINSSPDSKDDDDYLKLLTLKSSKSKDRHVILLTLSRPLNSSRSKNSLHGRSSSYGRLGHDQTTNSTLSSRIHTSANTLSFVKKLIEKLHSNRRQRNQDNIVINSPHDENNIDSRSSQSQQDNYTMEVLPAKKQSNKWFWESKNLFNHIKFNSAAPDHADYQPATVVDADDIRNWWYYHQSDFKPFAED